MAKERRSEQKGASHSAKGLLLPPKAYTAEAIEGFDQCGERYRLSFVEAAAPRPRERHELVKAYSERSVLKALNFLHCLEPSERTSDAASRALRHYWAKGKARAEIFGSPELEAEKGREALELVEAYCERYHDDLASGPLVVDEQLGAELSNKQKVSAHIDRLERDGDGELVAVIYDFAPRPRRLSESDRTAQILALSLHQSLAPDWLKVDRVSLTGQVTTTRSFDKDDLRTADGELVQITDSIRLGRTFFAYPGQWCEECLFRDRCWAIKQVSLSDLKKAEEATF